MAACQAEAVSTAWEPDRALQGPQESSVQNIPALSLPLWWPAFQRGGPRDWFEAARPGDRLDMRIVRCWAGHTAPRTPHPWLHLL